MVQSQLQSDYSNMQLYLQSIMVSDQNFYLFPAANHPRKVGDPCSTT